MGRFALNKKVNLIDKCVENTSRDVTLALLAGTVLLNARMLNYWQQPHFVRGCVGSIGRSSIFHSVGHVGRVCVGNSGTSTP